MTVKVSTHAPVVSNRDRVVLFTRRKIASTHDFVPFVFLGYSFHTWEHVHAVLSDKKLHVVVAKGCAFVNKLAPTSLRFRSVIIIIIIIITIIIIIITIVIVVVVVIVIVIVIVIYLSTYLFLFYYCILV